MAEWRQSWPSRFTSRLCCTLWTMRLSKMTARLRLAAIALVGVAVAASCATPPVEHADLVLRNGTIVTVDDLIPEVDALAVQNR